MNPESSPLPVGPTTRPSLARHTESTGRNEDLLAQALLGLIKLLDDGDLVRSTYLDNDLMAFMKQGIRVVNALKMANEALEKYHQNR